MAIKVEKHGYMIQSMTCPECNCKFTYNKRFDVQELPKEVYGTVITKLGVVCPECEYNITW